MRPVDKLVHARTRVRDRWALMPLEGYPNSRLPTWPDAAVRVLASPRLGAGFVQMLIDLPAGKHGDFVPDPEIETFHYVLEGEGEFLNGYGIERRLTPGSFGLTPPTRGVSITASTPMKILVLRKRYEPAHGFEQGVAHYGHESQVKNENWDNNPNSLLQLLIPDDLKFDIAMNIFTFTPGFGLPIVETHVMEHGLYFLQGKGVYYLEDTWMEVEQDDFIWMGPYCPQSFYATGPTPARYLYYKNVNREIGL
ncbi:MAG: (S)-ureidoglycine aminohydrolase [Tepidisphaeraceae bacterium]